MRVRRLVPIAVLAVAASAYAQSDRAPRETVTAQLNGKKVAVEYGRPSLRGRTVKDLLAQLPANRVWRAGVDQATTLSTESDILIGGKKVPAGKYSVYVYAPPTGDWALILNTDPGVPLKTIFPAAPPERADHLWPILDGYAKIAAKEVVRVPLKSAPAKEPMDRFLISLEPAKGGTSAITLTWGDRSRTVEVKDAGPATK